MSKSTRILCAALGFGGLLVGFGLAPGLAGPEKKAAVVTAWEYKVLALRDGNISGIEETWAPELNKAGEEGWEVAGTASQSISGNSMSLRVLLKRVKQ